MWLVCAHRCRLSVCIGVTSHAHPVTNPRYQTLSDPDRIHWTSGLLCKPSAPLTFYLLIPYTSSSDPTPDSACLRTVTSRARSRNWTPTLDPDRTRRTSLTSLQTFCSTYILLTHYLHVILGPHSGLRLPPDTRSTPLHHSVYPSALLTLFVFTRLHPLPCTGL